MHNGGVNRSICVVSSGPAQVQTVSGPLRFWRLDAIGRYVMSQSPGRGA